LAAWNFLMFKNCSSPFLAWAITPITNWGCLFIQTINRLEKKNFRTWRLLGKPKGL
jgi:hypothetical protein